MKKYGAIILLPVIGFILLCLGAVTYPPTPVSGVGPVIGSNSGSGTNNTFTTPTMSGVVTITNSSFKSGADSPFYLNGTIGPSINTYFGSLFGENLTFLGGTSGFFWVNKAANAYYMSLGHDWVFGKGDEALLRLYSSIDQTFSGGGDVRSGFQGTTVSAYIPMIGGNAAMMQGLPVHGGELAQRMPVMIEYVSTAGGKGGPSPVTNNCTTLYITNQVNQGYSNRYYQTVFQAGGDVEIGLEPGHLEQFRNPDGSLRWNSNAIPEGPIWLANYVHTNGLKIIAHLYYNPSWSNSTASGLVINDGGNYLTPVMTADRVSRDIGTYSDWGFDGVLIADMSTFVSIEGVGYRHALARQVAEEILNPRGLTPRNQTIPGQYMHMEEFLDMRGFPMGSAAYETACSHVGDGMGLPFSLTSPDYSAGRGAMTQLRQSWTNYAWMSGKGHYLSVCPLDVRTFNTNNNYLETVANGTFSMAASMLFPLYAFCADGFKTDAIWTNAATMSVMTNLAAQKLRFDSAYAPGFPVYDYGASNVSCWLKPLANGRDYALVMANETGVSSNMVFNWATNITSPNYFHAVNSPLYPVAIGTNTVFTFSDVFNGSNVTAQANNITITVTNHSCRIFRLTCKNGAGTDGLISYAADATYSLNTTGGTNTLGKNATAYVTATAVAFTVKDSAGTTLYTSPTLTATVCVHLQPLWSVNAASGLSGTVVRD